MPSMTQASQTVSREKPPSEPTLKGFELYGAESACVVPTAPCGASTFNRHDIDRDGHMMRHTICLHMRTGTDQEACAPAWCTRRHGTIKDRGKWTAAR
jgi:hypothetical protein